MSKTTPIQAAKKYVKLTFGERKNISANEIELFISSFLPMEKQTMQDVFEAGKEHQKGLSFRAYASNPDFETFYSQFNKSK